MNRAQAWISTFNEGEYMDERGHCQVCEASCAKCWGPTQEDCTSCPLSRVFDDGRCVLNCPSWKFEFSNQCHPCHHTCQGCRGSGPSNCTSCGADKHGQVHFLYRGECRESCPAGHYPTQEHTCQPCPDSCELCHSAHICTRCVSGYFLVPTNHTCQKLECRQGEVQDSDYEGCMSCEEGCLGCRVDDPGTCTSCAVGYYMFEHHCYQTCPEKTYTEERECKACHTGCGSCDQKECYWCEEGFFLLGGECVWECGPGFYGDEDRGECEPCHLSCEACSGPGSDQCSRCAEGLQLHLGACVPPAWNRGKGKFWNDILRTHEPCHSSCKTCNGSATQCTSCRKGAYLLGQTCVSSCPQGTWPSASSGSCEDCMEDCAACSGADRCEKCQPQPDHALLLHEGRCYSRCPQGFYAEDGECKRCHSPCSTCEGNATSCQSCEGSFVLDHGVCLEACPERHVAVDRVCKHCPENCQECIHEKTCKECMSGFILHSDVCHQSCPQGFYPDPDSQKCLPCHEDCKECSGPKADDCELCARFMVLYNGLCQDECPEGTYKEDLIECKECPESCRTCSSASTCESCREGLRMDWHNACVAPTECASVEFWDEEAHRCKSCHKKCSRCTGPREDQCRTCPGRSLLLNTTCVKDCPEGYYTDQDHRLCAPCHSSCRTCAGRHSLQCRSCRPGWLQLGTECLLRCREGYYAENSTTQCKKCDKSCRTCQGPRPTDCLSCDTFFFLLQSKGECHRTCPKHHYADPSTQTCKRCHPTCDECTGKGALSCSSCVWSYHLMGGICTSTCVVGKYRVGEGEQSNCEQCHESCVECKGPGARNCTACPADLLLYLEDGRCLPCCNTSNPTTQECCDCQDTMDECVLRTRGAGPAAERSKTALLITSSLMLPVVLGAAVIVWKKSRGRAQPEKKAGYEKLAEPSRSYSSYKSSYGGSSSFEEDQVIEYRDRDYDEDDDDDIVYMGQDGTVYRKFKYGLLDEDDEIELEYDDESYSY